MSCSLDAPESSQQHEGGATLLNVNVLGIPVPLLLEDGGPTPLGVPLPEKSKHGAAELHVRGKPPLSLLPAHRGERLAGGLVRDPSPERLSWPDATRRAAPDRSVAEAQRLELRIEPTDAKQAAVEVQLRGGAVGDVAGSREVAEVPPLAPLHGLSKFSRRRLRLNGRVALVGQVAAVGDGPQRRTQFVLAEKNRPRIMRISTLTAGQSGRHRCSAAAMNG